MKEQINLIICEDNGRCIVCREQRLHIYKRYDVIVHNFMILNVESIYNLQVHEKKSQYNVDILRKLYIIFNIK